MIALLKHYKAIVLTVIKYSLISSIGLSILLSCFTVNIPTAHASYTQRYSSKAPTNYINPPWWQGTQCDTYRHPGSYPLPSPSTWNNLTACGPMPEKGAPDVTVSFGTGSPQLEWECTELVMRYMFLAYHVIPYAAYGAQIVSSYNHTGSPTLTPIINNGQSGQVPQVGDILSYGIWGTKGGHTSIVIGYNSNTHYYTVFQQNAQYAITSQDVYLQGNIVKDKWEGAINGWLHANSAPPVDNAKYISQSPYPTVQTSQSFSIFFQLQNTGNTTWSDGGGYALVCSSNCMGINQVGFAGYTVQPQQQWTFNINLTAPSSPGTYTTQWELSHNSTSFGPGLSIIVTVQQPPTPSLSLSTGVSIPSDITIGQSVNVTYTITNTGGAPQSLIQLWLTIYQPDGQTFAFDAGGDGDINGFNNSIPANGGIRQFNVTFPDFGLNCGHSITTTNCDQGTYYARPRWEDINGGFHDFAQTSFYLKGGPSYYAGQTVIVRNYNGGVQEIFRTNNSGIVQFSFGNNQGWWPINPGQTTFSSGGKISVVLNHSNLLEVFARDTNNYIWYSMQTSPAQGNFTQWYELTTDTFAGDPFAIMNNSNQVQVFARAADNTIKTNWISLGGSWQSHWSTTTLDTFIGDPVAITRIDGDVNQGCQSCRLVGGIQLFALENNNTIGSLWSDNNGIWHSATFASYSNLNDPKVVISPVHDTLQVFSQSGMNVVTLEENSDGSWPTNWTLLPTPQNNASIAGNPQLIVLPGGAIEVYARANDGTIYKTWNYHNDTWASNWYQQSTALIAGDPEAILDHTSELWANFADGSGLYLDWIMNNGYWSGWNWEV